jgi:glyoxylase-like metal-dependent hydrolase (beta-lactamase superfamily II)
LDSGAGRRVGFRYIGFHAKRQTVFLCEPTDLKFNTIFAPRHGEAVEVADGVVRVTAPNPSPFTFHGTNTYIVGSNSLAVIDPGPADEQHLQALLKAIAGRPVSHILVTHTHRDHSPLARPLAEATGGTIVAEGPHRPARDIRLGEGQLLDASADMAFRPDHRVADQELIEGDGWALRAVLTPGHAANHAVFALEGTGTLFSGDHVMGWSTTIVAPPDGSMRDYMASLDRLLDRDDRLYLSGHGGPIRKPAAFVRGLRAHRKMRERAILERVSKGDRTIPEIVAAIYRDTDPRLFGAAGLSVFAHLEDLVERGAVLTEGAPALDGLFWACGSPTATA